MHLHEPPKSNKSADDMVNRAEKTATAEIAVSEELAEFYGIALSDDHVLEAAEVLENACPGLGDWFLNLDPDGEFQRDLLAGANIFWENRKGACGCSTIQSQN